MLVALASLFLTWYGAAIVGGLLIWLTSKQGSNPPPLSQAEIDRVIDFYRQGYGPDAASALHDHRLGATFWADRRTRELLAKVAAELRKDAPIAISADR